MTTLTFYAHGAVAPGPDVRVLRASDHAVFVKVEEALSHARGLAEERLRQAEEAYEERRREGFLEGQAEGKAEMALQMLDTLATSVEQVAAMENQIVDVVIQSIRRILGTFDQGELATQVVANALRLVRDEKRVLLRVSPGDADAVSARLDDIVRRYPGMMRVDLNADPALAPGGCVLETETGVVDASLERQLAIIEETFRRQLEERRA